MSKQERILQSRLDKIESKLGTTYFQYLLDLDQEEISSHVGNHLGKIIHEYCQFLSIKKDADMSLILSKLNTFNYRFVCFSNLISPIQEHLISQIQNIYFWFTTISKSWQRMHVIVFQHAQGLYFFSVVNSSLGTHETWSYHSIQELLDAKYQFPVVQDDLGENIFGPYFLKQHGLEIRAHDNGGNAS